MAMPRLDLKSKCNASSVNEAFSTLMGGGVAKVTEIPIDMLVPYENQPFKPYSVEKLELLAEDIKLNGVLNPVLVRQVDEDKFQILAGHNRVNACKKINMPNVPCIIKNVTDVEAELIMLNTNLNQRDELLPSEKAFAYKMQMDATKLQSGERTDLMPNGQKVDSLQELSNINNESRRNIARYIRLTFLFSPLLDMVDKKELPFRAGVELSYLSISQQKKLLEYMSNVNVQVTLDQATAIKNIAKQSDTLLLSQLDEIFGVIKKQQSAKKEKPCKVIISQDYINKYFDGKKPKEIQEELETILDEHFGKAEVGEL